ncbi:MAG: hypothetical protein MJD61_14890 [Proteobacteria bacterium]|nr:hypothetical protein [Pseudomonadota bacterium]
MEQEIRRGDLDPPPHEHTAAEAAVADARAALRASQRRFSDPFAYSDDRQGPMPPVVTIGEPKLSNTWRSDLSGGWTPGGFPWKPLHRDLVEKRIPKRVKKPKALAAWLAETIAAEEAEARSALRLVLAERHGRLRPGEAGSTRLATAWNHLAANRAQLRALRQLQKEMAAQLERDKPTEQLTLF